MKVLCTVVLLSSMLFGQVLYEEYFTGGAAQLQWDPWVIYTTMEVVNDPTTPGGDSWAGSVSNDSAPIAAMYAGDYALDDYSVEAWIYTTVTGGPMGSYNGICIRIDTASTVNALYQLVSDFDVSAVLRLRYIQGATPDSIRYWGAGEVPGGIPTSSSWHKLKLTVIGDSIWAYYDDVLLPDCPFIDARIDKGYFGIYFFNVMGGSTLCDDIIVTGATGISEYGSELISTFKVYPNPFSNLTTISFGIEQSAKSTELKIYDAAGRLVEDLSGQISVTGDLASVRWDGSTVSPGVYFITDGKGVQLEKVVKLR